jgi:LacI family transcriptional regulator
VCRTAEISVPGEVAVIGVDNDHLNCELSFLSLTSIEQGTHEIGRRAGEILNLLLQGQPPPVIRTVVPPTGVVSRASTDTLATDDPDAARTMRLISEHACHGLTPQQICREVGRSRSGLEERFKASFGRTLARAILDARLARAHELVAQSSLPLKEVADRSGFRSVQHMTTLFRQFHGRTPAAIRKAR